MEKHKEIGYKLGDILWHNLDGYQELWNNAEFDIKEKIINELGNLALELSKTSSDKYVEIIEDIFVWKWIGDPHIISDIEEIIKPHKVYSIGRTSKENCLFLSKKRHDGTSVNYANLNDYIIFDLNKEYNCLYSCSEEYFQENFKKVL